MVYNKQAQQRNKENPISERIVTQIITGKLKPGERLVERDLVSEFGVSRTPIREAIRKLENLGLVQCVPNRGAMVADFSPNDIESLYFVRIQLEHLAAKLSFSNLGPKEIKELQVINSRIQSSQKKDNLHAIIENDFKFHNVIYQATFNKFLIQVIQALRLKSYIVPFCRWTDPDESKSGVTEHKEIIKALKERKREKFQHFAVHQLIAAKTCYLNNLR
jgi:DNA-binding GntR family transcriptional regulator